MEMMILAGGRQPETVLVRVQGDADDDAVAAEGDSSSSSQTVKDVGIISSSSSHRSSQLPETESGQQPEHAAADRIVVCNTFQNADARAQRETPSVGQENEEQEPDDGERKTVMRDCDADAAAVTDADSRAGTTASSVVSMRPICSTPATAGQCAVHVDVNVAMSSSSSQFNDINLHIVAPTPTSTPSTPRAMSEDEEEEDAGLQRAESPFKVTINTDNTGVEGRQREVSINAATAAHSLRSRINRRPVQEKIRHKRQTLQDMSRPLKQWLYSHKDHPYPTRADKVTLALNSEMTLTQVSNWFANARRRLKNTVKGPDMGWGKRIKLYNSCVEGNQELLSVSSQDSMWDSAEEDDKKDRETGPMDLSTTSKEHDPKPVTISPVSPTGLHTTPQTEHVYAAAAPPALSAPVCDVNAQSADVCHTNGQSSPQEAQPSKFKHSILQRYLNDSYEHSLQVQQQQQQQAASERHRNASGSLSSHDYEDISVSSRSSPVREHLVLDDFNDYEEISRQWPHIEDRAEEDLYWKEISAALALTTLAKSRFKSSTSSSTTTTA